MRIAVIDLNDDARNGKHLDRELNRLSHGTFHPVQAPILTALEQTSLPSTDGLEIVAAVPLRTLTHDERNWNFGNGTYADVTAGTCVITSNYIGLWLCDKESKPCHCVGEIFLSGNGIEEFLESCRAGFMPPLCDESKSARERVRAIIGERVRQKTKLGLMQTRQSLHEQAKVQADLLKKQEALTSLLLVIT